jgi:hypothetical protein
MVIIIIIIIIIIITIMMMGILKLKADRTFHSNKADIIIRDNEKINTYINRQCNFRRLKYDREKTKSVWIRKTK